MNRRQHITKVKETTLRASESMELMLFLLNKMGGMSRNSVKSLLAHRQVLINGTIITKYNYQLVADDIVTVRSSRGNIELTHPKLKIIFEDQYIIVVDKKEGLLTETTGRPDETTAFSILKNYVKKSSPQNRIYIVHRLDRETSGVLVFAKTKEIQLKLQENWHRAVLRREYIALVQGHVEKDRDTIVTWLKEHPVSLKIHSSDIDNGGQKAVTHYKTLKQNEHFSLLQIELETGRKNQIRVHLQELGHPIVGDKKYGSEIITLGRLCLHARTISFYHPHSGEVVGFETPIPKIFNRVFSKVN